MRLNGQENDHDDQAQNQARRDRALLVMAVGLGLCLGVMVYVCADIIGTIATLVKIWM